MIAYVLIACTIGSTPCKPSDREWPVITTKEICHSLADAQPDHACFEVNIAEPKKRTIKRTDFARHVTKRRPSHKTRRRRIKRAPTRRKASRISRRRVTRRTRHDINRLANTMFQQ